MYERGIDAEPTAITDKSIYKYHVRVRDKQSSYSYRFILVGIIFQL